MKKGLCILLMGVLLTLPGCTVGRQGTALERYEATYLDLFDTVTSIVGYADSQAAFSKQAAFVYEQLHGYHQLYDIYNSYEGVTNLKSVNDQAGKAPVAVDVRILDLLAESKQMYGLTGGKVNVAMGSVLALWHTYRQAGLEQPEQAALPPMDALRQAAQHTDISKVVLDMDQGTVYLADPDMRLDVGAIAKGYAAQRVAEAAREQGYTSLLISIGGNVCAVGAQAAQNKPWRVAVQDPEDANAYLHVLAVADRTLVTSGSYQRYYTVGGKPYHHIIDPDTLMPSGYFLSVTVVAEDSGQADALATALFNLPYEEGLLLVEALPGVEALWVAQDRTEQYSSGLASYLDDA